MSDAVLQFLLANLALSGGILLVFVLRKPVRSQFGARLGYALWLLPLLAAAASFLPPRVVEIVAPAVVAPASESALFAAPAAATVVVPVVAPAVAIDPWALGGLVWIAGMIAMVVWLAAVQMRFMAGVRRGEAGPAVVGFLHPRIVTPTDFEMRYDPGERRVILAHETIHLDRNDARINALAAFVRCICWFNPLVHVAAHFLRIDQELACDAAVVERHPKARKLYADALLKTQLVAHPLPLGCYWPAGTEHPLMERIEMLKQTKPGRVRRIVGGALLAAVFSGAGLAAWAAMPAEERLVFETPEPQQAPPPAAVVPASFDANDPIHLLGKVEKIDFSETTYVAFVRASSITACPTGPAQVDTALWELSPTSYWGDRDAVIKDIMNADVYVRGFNARDKSCAPNCRMLARAVFRSSPSAGFGTNYMSHFTDPALTCRQPIAQPTRYEPQPEPQTPPSAASEAVKKPSPEADGAPQKLFENKIEKEIIEKKKFEAQLKAPGPGESLAKKKAVEADAAERALVIRKIEKALAENENRQEVRKEKVPNDPALIDKPRLAEEVEKLRKVDEVDERRRAEEVDKFREKLRKGDEADKFREVEKLRKLDKGTLGPKGANPKEAPGSATPAVFEPQQTTAPSSETAPPSPIRILAEHSSYDEASKTGIFEGNVEMRFKGQVFRTDRVIVEETPDAFPALEVRADTIAQDQQSGTGVYSGNVVLRGGNIVLKADRLAFEPDSSSALARPN